MTKKEILLGLFLALAVAIFLSPFASPWLDGLERVARDKGFLEKGDVQPAITAPIPDYIFPGIPNEKIATSMSGAIGTLLAFAFTYILAKVLAGV